MKVLVTGHRGILGRALLAELPRRGWEAVGVDVPEMDVTDEGRVHAVFARERPAAVINCAAFTHVDACEEQEELCYNVNARGAQNVAAAAAEGEARIIHLSTDYVFDGASRVPYTEEDEPAPLSVYGAGKLDGERLVAAAAPDHLLVRTAGLFGVGGVSFVSKILTRAKDGEALAVVDDQVVSPTYARHLAAALAELLGVNCRGVLHVASSGAASWYEVAAEILALTGITVPLRAVATADLDFPAPRPAYSALDTSRYVRLTGRAMPTWQEGLAAYLSDINERGADAR